MGRANVVGPTSIGGIFSSIATVAVQSARKSRSRASGARKVKSKEIVDDGASDDSDKDGGTEAGGADGKKKSRQSHKSRAAKDGKVHRKRPTKNKVTSPCV